VNPKVYMHPSIFVVIGSRTSTLKVLYTTIGLALAYSDQYYIAIHIVDHGPFKTQKLDPIVFDYA